MKSSAILSMFLSPIGHTPSETCRQVPAFSSSTLTTVPDSARQAALDPSRQTIARMPLSSRTISQPQENLRLIDLQIGRASWSAMVVQTCSSWVQAEHITKKDQSK